jgi:hypothetical protein
MRGDDTREERRRCAGCGAELVPAGGFCASCGVKVSSRRRRALVLVALVGLDVVVSVVAVFWVAVASADRTATYGRPGPSDAAAVDGLVAVIGVLAVAIVWQGVLVCLRERLPRLLGALPAPAVTGLMFATQFVVLLAFWMPASH